MIRGLWLVIVVGHIKQAVDKHRPAALGFSGGDLRSPFSPEKSRVAFLFRGPDGPRPARALKAHLLHTDILVRGRLVLLV